VNICSLAHAYGEALEKGELKLEAAAGRPRLKHFDNSWPLGPASWGVLLQAEDPGKERPGGCFEDLERLRWFNDIGDADRAAYRLAAAQAQGLLDEATVGGVSNRQSIARSATPTFSTGSSSGSSSRYTAGSSRVS